MNPPNERDSCPYEGGTRELLSLCLVKALPINEEDVPHRHQRFDLGLFSLLNMRN
jgi:hypothetical protein